MASFHHTKILSKILSHSSSSFPSSSLCSGISFLGKRTKDTHSHSSIHAYLMCVQKYPRTLHGSSQVQKELGLLQKKKKKNWCPKTFFWTREKRHLPKKKLFNGLHKLVFPRDFSPLSFNSCDMTDDSFTQEAGNDFIFFFLYVLCSINLSNQVQLLLPPFWRDAEVVGMCNCFLHSYV